MENNVRYLVRDEDGKVILEFFTTEKGIVAVIKAQKGIFIDTVVRSFPINNENLNAKDENVKEEWELDRIGGLPYKTKNRISDLSYKTKTGGLP